MEEFKKLENEIRNCKKCDLWKTRKNPVIGEGSINTKIMFVGEAPGYNEDLTGHPFCGAAGKILDELLNSISLKREDIYITNILKCRPPQNRNPSEGEIKACVPYLDKQIKIIKPKVIASLGNFAMQYIFKKFDLKPEKISSVHGKVFVVSNLTGNRKIVPLYHPATATYNPNIKEVLLRDFKVLNRLN
jgi:DNA polymerase